jgi:hypothetical protein
MQALNAAASTAIAYEKANRDGRPDLLYSIDQFSVLDGLVHLRGWAFVPGARVDSVEICFPSGAKFAVASYGQASADVAAVHGADAAQVRFDEAILANQPLIDVPSAWLVIGVEGLPPAVIKNLGAPRPHDPGEQIHNEFIGLLTKRPNGHLLEIGSRPRFGGGRKNYVPAGWSYTGLDIQAGENVDVVGDAHKLSRLFPTTRFDAVASFSVLEHLMMPWKFVVELNKVLNPGAVGFMQCHQCWPIHERPWDFWRVSDTAWASLLNRPTGFEIHRTALGEAAFVVPERLHAATNFGADAAGFLTSSVIFRKVGDTKLDWPVDIEDITDTRYPTSE